MSLMRKTMIYASIKVTLEPGHESCYCMNKSKTNCKSKEMMISRVIICKIQKTYRGRLDLVNGLPKRTRINETSGEKTSLPKKKTSVHQCVKGKRKNI